MNCVFISVFPLPDIKHSKGREVEFYSNRESQNVVISCFVKINNKKRVDV